MKLLQISFLILCLSTNAYAGNNGTTIQIIMDDSGVLERPKIADQYKMQLFSHLKKLVKKRKFTNAHMDVISTSMGRTVWSGTPKDLKRKPEKALSLVKQIKAEPKNCNNLPGSFAELKSNIASLKREGYKHAHVIVFSSLIHTPRPCSDTTNIILPQSPPVKADINQALISSDIARSIKFYWVSPHQKKVWEEYLKPVFKWALLKNISIRFMDIERSKFSLEQGLDLGVRK